VGFLPGLTDNVGRTSAEALADIYDDREPVQEAVYTSQLYLFRGALQRRDVERVVRDVLANPLIHQWRITAAADWQDGLDAFLPPPVAGVNKLPQVETLALDGNDAQLVHLSQERLLSLNLEEMQAIQAHFRDPRQQERRQAYGLGPHPTDVELEALARFLMNP
jgi:phosphoribosylformylglycinamidine synthase